MSEGTHITHCCINHGCKYAQYDCPVFNGRLKQESPCELCDEVGQWVSPKDKKIERLEATIEQQRLELEFKEKENEELKADQRAIKFEQFLLEDNDKIARLERIEAAAKVISYRHCCSHSPMPGECMYCDLDVALDNS